MPMTIKMRPEKWFKSWPCLAFPAADSLRTLHKKFNSKLTAATLGVGGVIAWDGNELMKVAAYQVAARDTTGAGDVFHAGFIYGLAKALPLRRTLEFASAAAALNCRALGARGIARVEEIEELMRTGQKYPFSVAGN